MKNEYVIGLDFGTDSVRAVLTNADNGEELASHVHWYDRWRQKKYCEPHSNQFRQHPLDHIEGMEATIKTVVAQSQVDPAYIKGICIDTTGSSPVPVYKDGRPLALVEGFEENPNAMMVLWKDHTAIDEAAEINHLAKSWGGEDFTKYEGGIYSSEWFWAKILHIIREDKAVSEQAYTWMEHCDLMTYWLIVDRDLESFKRSRCAAGHKAMWHAAWGGLPADDFLSQLDPRLITLKNNLYQDTYTSDEVAGKLSKEWAQKLGLTEDTVVAVGTFDAHSGAVGAEVEEHTLVRVMGTSTCDIIVASNDAIGDNLVEGICGQVDGSVIPGMVGLEAGQSAFGDVLAWFGDILNWPLDHLLANSSLIDEATKQKLTAEIKQNLLKQLSDAAEKIPVSESAPVALDWVNGRRTPDANQALKGAMMNLTLGTQAPQIFRALVESICFGAKNIVDRFTNEGVRIDTVVGIGGVAKKSPFIMQTLANVLNMPIKIAVSEQAPALGAAMYAAVAAGIYTNIQEASSKMGSGFEAEYHPQHDQVELYKTLFTKYSELGAFVESITKTQKQPIHE
ncbi:ribulokinase [Fulvivirga ligni]|uniref:ribulokinase n=1 Tax=Fulvivirga ligni TaxID=2904246 RepID=UPI001F168CA2|nr:ribulokinase [Fulvivirga ligni]UII23445.1 ribulokinase [Fulvivirga ligni]